MGSRDSIRLDELTITGVSSAGVETWFRIRPPDAAFDVGRGASELVGVDRVFLSHGHLDHVAGLPSLLSQRSLHGLGPTSIYCPREIETRVEQFVQAASLLEEREYSYAMHGLSPGDAVDFARDLRVEAFATDHVVPSLGYLLIRTVERLKDEFRGRVGEELATLRRRGVEIVEREDRVWLAYAGDSTAEVFERESRVLEARVLIVECTFLGSRWKAQAGQHGHLHVEDLRLLEERSQNEHVVLHHLSRRFSLQELRRAVDSELPRIADRVHILGEGAQRS